MMKIHKQRGHQWFTYAKNKTHAMELAYENHLSVKVSSVRLFKQDVLGNKIYVMEIM